MVRFVGVCVGVVVVCVCVGGDKGRDSVIRLSVESACVRVAVVVAASNSKKLPPPTPPPWHSSPPPRKEADVACVRVNRRDRALVRF